MLKSYCWIPPNLLILLNQYTQMQLFHNFKCIVGLFKNLPVQRGVRDQQNVFVHLLLFHGAKQKQLQL